MTPAINLADVSAKTTMTPAINLADISAKTTITSVINHAAPASTSISTNDIVKELSSA